MRQLRVLGLTMVFVLVLIGAKTIDAKTDAAQTTSEGSLIRYAGEIGGVVKFCGAQGTDGTILTLLGRSFSVRTGASGDFLFNYVPAGTYSLLIQVPGQVPVVQSVTVVDKHTTNLGTITVCPDNDHDGYGATTDCNDNNPLIHPGATEKCDGVDNNCNGTIDEGCATCTDADQDGYKAQASCGTPVDCNDNSATIHPGATEVCNGVDDNCNGTADETFNLGSDPINCGQCGHVCSFPNGTPACANGSCHLVTCTAPFANCDANDNNGCETDLLIDAKNCGGCNVQCGSNQSCTQGVCN